ncbi:MAG: RNase H family protein [bacterium]
MKKNEIIIYTDGSSLGNPGKGGWGSVILFPDGKVVELGGHEKESTNNRMEMTAALEALNVVLKRKQKAKTILIHTDSSYLLNGITMWIYAWVKNNWQTKTKEDVLNKDIWEVLYKVENNLKNKYEIEWIKVKGHNGVFLNERCDEIATGFSAQTHPILFTGNVKDYEKLFGKITHAEKKEEESKKTIKKSSSKKDAYSYVSEVAGKIHADKTWVECEKRVKGKSGAKYKKVFSKQEEQELIALWSLKSLF